MVLLYFVQSEFSCVGSPRSLSLHVPPIVLQFLTYFHQLERTREYMVVRANGYCLYDWLNLRELTYFFLADVRWL